MGNSLELFDTHNRLNFPTEAQIAVLSKEAQDRFENVRKAKAKLDAATKHREAVAQRIKDNDAARVATKEAMDEIRPSGTDADRTANIKAHIASEQRQRRQERGLSE